MDQLGLRSDWVEHGWVALVKVTLIVGRIGASSAEQRLCLRLGTRLQLKYCVAKGG